jgi:hypothetical protein
VDPLLVVVLGVLVVALVWGLIDFRRGREPDPGQDENPYRWTPGP